MFGIGMSEMLIILSVALLVFGPQKLPEIAKSIAKGLKELRRAGDDLRSSVNFDLDDDKPMRRPPPRTQHPLPEAPAAIAGSELAHADDLATDHPPAASLEAAQWPQPAEGTTSRSSDEAADGLPKVH